MSGERGVFRIIFQSLWSSFKPRTLKRKLVGVDIHGTKYYEETLTVYSHKSRPPRYFEPMEKEKFDQELPAEWEAWLRYRRKEPPTIEEIEENMRIAMMKKINAAELEAKYSLEQPAKPDTITNQNERRSFPVYEDYKNQ